MAVSKLPDGRWITYYRSDGKIKKEYFGRGAEGEAAARARDQELHLKPRRPRTSAANQGLDFFDCVEAYLRSRSFNANSRKVLDLKMSAHILPHFGHKTAIRINDTDMDRYVQKRRAGGVKDSTIRRDLTDVKSVLNFAATRRPPIIPFNPVRDYKLPREDDAVLVPPTDQELTAIINAAAPHLQRAISIAYYTGLRPGATELLRLTWDDVYWQSSIIMITSAAKGGVKARQVPLHPDFEQNLREWYQTDMTLAIPGNPIIHYHQKPVQSIRTAWKRAKERAGITRRIRQYDIRHKFVTDAIERGLDIKTISEIVGSDPKTLMQHYQHITKRMRQQAIAGIPALGIRKYTQKSKDND